jgi:hypothetical protein
MKEAIMSTRTIKWTCTAEPNWQWLSSADGNPGIPLGSGEISGTITLSPNANYWYPCINLILQNGGPGNAMLRFFNNGTDVVQAKTVAQGEWVQDGNIGSQSTAPGSGGITLIAELQ